MNTETKQVGTYELSETELSQVNGGGFTVHDATTVAIAVAVVASGPVTGALI
jgi:bacteriocin-like protein